MVQKRKMKWIPPNHGWRKINCVTAYVDGNTVLAMVVHDDDGLLAVACSKMIQLTPAYEAELKSIE